MNDSIDSLRFDGNWKVPPKLGREFLADGIGQELESVASRIEEVFLDAEEDSCSALYVDAKHPRRKNQIAAFLVVAEENAGHQVATTVYLRRKGEDLFVRIGAAANTKIRLMHWVLRSVLVAALFLLAYGVYFQNTGQREALLLEYARKQNPSDPGNFFQAIDTGYRWDPSLDSFVKAREPMQIGDVLREDPKLFLMNMAGPPTIILTVIGVLVALIPATAFDFASRMMGWPTVADFNSFISAEVAGADAIIRQVLENDFGVRKVSSF